MTRSWDAARIAEVRARCEAATTGPLDVGWPEGFGHLPAEQVPYGLVVDEVGNQVADCYDNRRVGDKQAEADATFFAAARTDLPEALDEIERLTKQAAEWREWIANEIAGYGAAPRPGWEDDRG